MDGVNNSLEIVLNLIYLAKHSASDSEALDSYLTQAETEVQKLAELHRQDILPPPHLTDAG